MLYPLIVERCLLPALALVSTSRFWHLEKQMIRQERAPADEIQRRQWSAVQELLTHAYQTVPFYRERLDAVGLRPEHVREPADLTRLPPTTRQDVDTNFPDRITSSSRSESCRVAATSGTTSQRILVLQDFAKRDSMRGPLAHSFRFCGQRLGVRYVEMPPDVCNVQCGLKRQAEPPLWRFLGKTSLAQWKEAATLSDLRGMVERQLVYRQLIISSFAADGVPQPEDICAEYLAQIRAYRPAVLKALPAYLLLLARYLRDHRLPPPRLREVRPMGAALAPSVRTIIQEAFACKVVEDYGCAELGAISCECIEGQGLHLFADLFYLEIIKDGAPARPGELGRILLTDLGNRAMPLIRYDIGDLGYFLEGRCGCGRNTPRFKVLGRSQDAVVRPSGRIFAEHELADFFYSYPAVQWFQLTQQSEDRIEVKVVAGPTHVPLDEAQVIQDLKALLGAELRVTLRKVRTITPESGGKFRFLKSTYRKRPDATPVTP